MIVWTVEDISKILIQLDEMSIPFSKYSLRQEEGKLILLGRGGSAEVFEAQLRSSQKKSFAMKVIGFRSQNTDSVFFNESARVQQDMSISTEYVVKVYDYTEVWVELDDKDNVVSAVKKKPNELTKTTIKLQFVLMEKISSVVTRTKEGKIKLSPEVLAKGDEQEILKLAYDIGIALKKAHNENCLHRDVKLENVFYSEKKKQYKLGDFGIAKKTKDGFAETIAFTKGYAAPEVRYSSDRYDNTADIYSFGMMLYVLANGLKFPDSNIYSMSSSMQYEPGYIVPKPAFLISEDLYHIIVKACMYNPIQRYQSMDEMLIDIEKLLYPASIANNINQRNSTRIVSLIMSALCVVAWKLTMAKSLQIEFSLWEYIFLVACIGKGVNKEFKKNNVLLSLGVLGVGIYIIVSTGFSWIKLVFLIWMTFSSGKSSAYIAVGALLANLTSVAQGIWGLRFYSTHSDSWVVIALIMVVIILSNENIALTEERRSAFKSFYDKGYYWGTVITLFTIASMLGCINPIELMYYFPLMGHKIVFCMNHKVIWISLLAFSLFWVARERLLAYLNKIE